MTENQVERSALSALDIAAYSDEKKKNNNHANLFFKDDIGMTTTEKIPEIGLNECHNVEVHSQDPNRVIISSSENCTVHIYSDKFDEKNPIPQSNLGELAVNNLSNKNCQIIYHLKSDFPKEYTVDNCNLLKDGKITARINAEFSGKITGENSLQVGKR